MSAICLVHVTYYDPALAAEVTWRGCTGAGFVTGTNAAYRPPGVAAHIAYEPRIIQPASMRRDCFSRGATGGESQIGYGEMVLNNVDGALDAWPGYGFDGRTIEIIIGHMSPFQMPVWTTVLKGTMEQPRFSLDKIAIRLRDRQAELDVPAVPARFGGTNDLPAGLDGVATDLQGKVIPSCWGVVFNVPAPCVNTSRLIYQVNTGPVLSIDAAYDRGLALTKGADYPDQATMESTAPAAGQFRVWPAGGYARLGATPAGQITFDVSQGGASALEYAVTVSGGGNCYAYHRILAPAYVVQPGDVLMYDVWVDPSSPAGGAMAGGIEVDLTAAPNNGRSAGLVDQYGSALHVIDSAVHAIGVWFGRSAALDAIAGKTINSVNLVVEADAAGIYKARYRNIRIVSAAGAAALQVWAAGAPALNLSAYSALVSAETAAEVGVNLRTAGQVAAAIATGPGGIAPLDIVAADIAALDASNDAEIGLWIDADTTCRAALDQVLGSVGAWWGFDRLGKFRMRRIEAPAASPAAVFNEANIIQIDRVATSDPGAGVPAWRATLRYRRRWLTQDADLAGSVTDARRAELREPWQVVVAEDPAVRTAHRLAPELAWESLINDGAAASAEVSRRLALYKVPRDRYEARTNIDDSSVDLGASAALDLPRYDLAGGKPMLVMGIQADLRLNVYDLTLWG